MASLSEFDSDYIFSMDFRDISPSPTGENAAAATATTTAMWGEENFPFGNGTIDIMPLETDIVSQVFGTSFYPERQGIPSMDVAEPMLSEFDIGLRGIEGNQSFGAGYVPDMYELCEKRNGFASDFTPLYASPDVWGIQSNSLPTTEEPSSKVGRYSVEERKDRILKYLKKRNRRNFNKTIKYACRKTLADRRVRVRGRFARNNDLCEEAMAMKNDINHHEAEEFYDEDASMKHNEDEWLQEALMYLPIFAG